MLFFVFMLPVKGGRLKKKENKVYHFLLLSSGVHHSSGLTEETSLSQLLRSVQWTTVLVTVQRLLEDSHQWYSMRQSILEVRETHSLSHDSI